MAMLLAFTTVVSFMLFSTFALVVMPLSKLTLQLDPSSRHLFINTATSCVHASVVSLPFLAITYDGILGESTELFDDMLYATHPRLPVLFAFSLGYFVWDSIHLIFTGLLRRDPTMVIHHGMTMVGALFGLQYQIAHPFMVLTGLMEVNSVFLHLRMCLRLKGRIGTSLYRFTVRANIITFLVFRIALTVYGSYLTAFYCSGLPPLLAAFGVLGCVLLLIGNLRLFKSILRKDKLSA